MTAEEPVRLISIKALGSDWEVYSPETLRAAIEAQR